MKEVYCSELEITHRVQSSIIVPTTADHNAWQLK